MEKDATVYVINYAPIHVELTTIEVDKILNTQKVYRKEDGNCFFSDIWYVDWLMAKLKKENPLNVYWMTGVIVKRNALQTSC